MVAVKLVTELPAGGRGVGRHRNEDAQTLLDAATLTGTITKR